MKDMRRTKLEGWFEFYRIACPICGHAGGCMQHKDGDAIVCIRVKSDKPFSKNSSLPSFLHLLKGDKKRKKINVDNVPLYQGLPKKEDALLNEVYQAFIDCLDLEESHYQHLISPSRQLSDEQIMVRGYRSFPEQPWNIVKDISDITGIKDFSGVPGFFEAKGKYGHYWSIQGMEGILIPFRNHKNQVVGFQYRIDNPPNEVKVQERKQGIRATVITQPNIVQVSYEGEVLFEREFELGKTETIMHNSEILGWVTLKKGNRYFWCAKRFSISA
ncbi:hypothetical protein [Ferdinandcohnia sp. SAFN-114]|uniref:hypothetical protein n=1 Tax=Ferdinandcohnia sp. SAFN-114 TaxID=3387275 RepID=UPI003F80B12F